MLVKILYGYQGSAQNFWSQLISWIFIMILGEVFKN